MTDDVIAQVIGAILTAAILAAMQHLYKKYSQLNDWTKILILHIANIAWGLVVVFLGVFCAENLQKKMFYSVLAVVSFASTVFMFIRVLRVVKKCETLVDKITKKDTYDCGDKV